MYSIHLLWQNYNTYRPCDNHDEHDIIIIVCIVLFIKYINCSKNEERCNGIGKCHSRFTITNHLCMFFLPNFAIFLFFERKRWMMVEFLTTSLLLFKKCTNTSSRFMCKWIIFHTKNSSLQNMWNGLERGVSEVSFNASLERMIFSIIINYNCKCK